ncbi:hypothetical protein BGZ93_008454 [Podila epicladia]|nr:hypothetical protein BGZ92_002177 [Podila epicladia]KAG0092131.1 hypothetical protein BGZ93_008454 [Podila epicladia]
MPTNNTFRLRSNGEPYFSNAFLSSVDFRRGQQQPVAQDQPAPTTLLHQDQEEPLEQLPLEQGHVQPQPFQVLEHHQEPEQVLTVTAQVSQAMTDDIRPSGSMPRTTLNIHSSNDGDYVLVKPFQHYEQASASTTPIWSPSASVVLTRPTTPYMFHDDEYDRMEDTE